MGVETIAALLQNLTISINGLSKRMDALEQSQCVNHSTKKLENDTENDQPIRESNEANTTTDTIRAKHDQEKRSKEANLLRRVEFREKVYLNDTEKLDWKILSPESDQKTTSEVSFRYDTDENGKLAFVVFRSAKIFHWLIKVCPPAADGQVNLLADGLVFEDAFPLLHARPQIKEYKKELEKKTESPHHDPTLEELKVLEKLYERDGHFKNAMIQYERMRKTEEIDFPSLKGLFRRDQLVVFRELRDELTVARVTMITATDGNDRYGREVKLDLDCKAIDFDGKKFRYHLYRKTIKVFAGSKNITELEIYPLEYSPEKFDIIKKSINSGERWWKLHKTLTDEHEQSRVAVMHYEGYCETFGANADDENGGKGSQVQIFHNCSYCKSGD